MKEKAPDFLQSVLWSYDLNEIDLERDKIIIITQVLNYGLWEEVKWLYSVYMEKDIRGVISNPGRGLWFDKVLNFWEKMFDIHIPEKKRRQAIFNIDPWG